uniref:hypothetical protein n=1 Tax=Nitrospira cf. moscoviensis SBR1015 TaxID=96242 RepID=UPI00111E6F71|nr:hypothetical protein [Nitrospira cf. moscoviensis SBR1015]
MPLPSKVRMAEKLAQLQAGFRHAFAVQPESQPLSIDDVELMERVADVIVKRGMTAPATVFLESMGPMNFLGSQALHFFTPIIECAFNVKEVEQVARLLERRETIPQLIAVIEAKSSIVRASAQ